MVLRKFLYIVCSFLGITCISAQDIDSVYSELLSLLDKKAIDWMESIEYTQRQALLLNKLGKPQIRNRPHKMTQRSKR